MTLREEVLSLSEENRVANLRQAFKKKDWNTIFDELSAPVIEKYNEEANDPYDFIDSEEYEEFYNKKIEPIIKKYGEEADDAYYKWFNRTFIGVNL